MNSGFRFIDPEAVTPKAKPQGPTQPARPQEGPTPSQVGKFQGALDEKSKKKSVLKQEKPLIEGEEELQGPGEEAEAGSAQEASLFGLVHTTYKGAVKKTKDALTKAPQAIDFEENQPAPSAEQDMPLFDVSQKGQEFGDIDIDKMPKLQGTKSLVTDGIEPKPVIQEQQLGSVEEAAEQAIAASLTEVQEKKPFSKLPISDEPLTKPPITEAIQPKSNVSAKELSTFEEATDENIAETFSEEQKPLIQAPIADTIEPKSNVAKTFSEEQEPLTGLEVPKKPSSKAKVLEEHMAQALPQPIISPIETRIAPVEQKTTYRQLTIDQLVEQITAHITTLTTKDIQQTSIEIKYPPIFAGAQVTIQEFSQAKGEFNLVFQNLSPQARLLVESQIHQKRLNQALEEKGYKVHLISIEAPVAPQASFEVPSKSSSDDRGKNSTKDSSGGFDQGKGSQRQQ